MDFYEIFTDVVPLVICPKSRLQTPYIERYLHDVTSNSPGGTVTKPTATTLGVIRYACATQP
jgi:hypothetical protein